MVAVYGMVRTYLVAAREGYDFFFRRSICYWLCYCNSFFLFVTLLVGSLSHLHCVYSNGPLCFLIFLVLWFSMFTVVLVVFLFLLLFLYIFNFSFHPKKGVVILFFLTSTLFSKEVFPRILDRRSISEVVDQVLEMGK